MLWPPHLLDFEPRALRGNLSCRRDFMLEMVAGTRIKVRAETVLTRTGWTLAPARKALIELAAKPVMVIADPCRQAQANARLRHDPIRTGRRQRRSVVPDAHHSQRGLGRKSGQAHSGSPFSHQNVVYLPLSVLTMHAGTDGDPSEAPRRAGPRTLAATEGLCAAASNIRPITLNDVVKLLGESGGFFV